MYDLIDKSSFSVGLKINVQLRRHLQNLSTFVDKVISFEQAGGKMVDNSHPLVALAVTLMPRDDEADLLSYISRVRNREAAIANSLGINHSGHVGKIKFNTFYACKEIYVLDRSSADPATILDIEESYLWREQEPVRVMKTPRYHNPLNVPKGRREKIDSDYACVSINIQLFAVMLYIWKKENLKRSEGERESTVAFVSRYVIPNMMPSQLLACINDIVFCAIADIPYFMDDFTGKLYAKDYSREIYAEYKKTWKDAPQRKLKAKLALKSIPGYGGKELLTHVWNLEDANTVQSYAGWIPAYIMYVKIIATIIKVADIDDGIYANQVRRAYRRINGNKILTKYNDKPMMELVEGDLARIALDLGI